MTRVRYHPTDHAPAYSERELLLLTLETCEQLHERLERVDEILTGNGQPGVVTRLAHLEGSEQAKARQLGVTGGLGGVIGAVLTAVLAKLGLGHF